MNRNEEVSFHPFDLRADEEVLSVIFTDDGSDNSFPFDRRTTTTVSSSPTHGNCARISMTGAVQDWRKPSGTPSMEALLYRFEDFEKKAGFEIHTLKRQIEDLECRLAASEKESLVSEKRIDAWEPIGRTAELGEAMSTDQPFKLPKDIYSILSSSSSMTMRFWISMAIIIVLQLFLFALLLFDQVRFPFKLYDLEALKAGGNKSYVSQSERPLSMPINVELSVRIAQVLALLVSIFNQDDMRIGVEGIVSGRPSQFKGSERFRCMKKRRWHFSYFIRFVAGFLGLFVSFVLLVQAETVFDVLLNFLGVTFISELDDLGFKLGERGYLGASMAKATQELTEAEFRRKEFGPGLCSCLKKYAHVMVMFTLVVVMFVWYFHLAWLQFTGVYYSKYVHVKFGDDQNLVDGCYKANGKLRRNRFSYVREEWNNADYETVVRAKFCKIRLGSGEYQSGWTFYMGDEWGDDCPPYAEEKTLAFSPSSNAMDLVEVGSTQWLAAHTNRMIYVSISPSSDDNCENLWI